MSVPAGKAFLPPDLVKAGAQVPGLIAGLLIVGVMASAVFAIAPWNWKWILAVSPLIAVLLVVQVWHLIQLRILPRCSGIQLGSEEVAIDLPGRHTSFPWELLADIEEQRGKGATFGVLLRFRSRLTDCVVGANVPIPRHQSFVIRECECRISPGILRTLLTHYLRSPADRSELSGDAKLFWERVGKLTVGSS